MLLAEMQDMSAKPPALDPKILGPVTQVAAKHFPGVPVLPLMSTGATDGVFFAALGIPEPTAGILAAAADKQMGECILSLYRSATQPAMVEWGKDVEGAKARPGLFLHAPEDPYVGKGRGASEVAAAMGASVGELTGRGHWWMVEDPAQGAEVLEAWVSKRSVDG